MAPFICWIYHTAWLIVCFDGKFQGKNLPSAPIILFSNKIILPLKLHTKQVFLQGSLVFFVNINVILILPIKKIILEFYFILFYFFNVVFLMGNIHCCWTMLLMFLKLTLRVFVKNKMENLKYFSSEQAKDMLILHFCFPWPVFFDCLHLRKLFLKWFIGLSADSNGLSY